jgi:hypothetical protein
MIEGLRRGEEQHFDREGRYLALPPHPPHPPGTERRPWGDHPPAYAQIFGRRRLDRSVFCQYAVAAEGEAFTIEAICDPHGEGDAAAYGLVKPAPGHARGIAGVFGRCDPRGVYGHATGAFSLGAHGACDARSHAALARPLPKRARPTKPRG